MSGNGNHPSIDVNLLLQRMGNALLKNTEVTREAVLQLQRAVDVVLTERALPPPPTLIQAPPVRTLIGMKPTEDPDDTGVHLVFAGKTVGKVHARWIWQALAAIGPVVGWLIHHLWR